MAENLTDRQAAEAVRDRICRGSTRSGWPWRIRVSITAVLSEFRRGCSEHGLEQMVLDVLLARLVERGPGEGGRQAAHGFHARGRGGGGDLNRLELAGESVRAAVEALAAAAPEWFAAAV